jgi:hypothetical protein
VQAIEERPARPKGAQALVGAAVAIIGVLAAVPILRFAQDESGERAAEGAQRVGAAAGGGVADGDHGVRRDRGSVVSAA